MKIIGTHPVNHSAHLPRLIITSLALITLLATPAAALHAPAAGSISGTVRYYGTLADGLNISVGYHTDLSGPPVNAVDILSPGGAYNLTGVADGDYYLSAFLDANSSGGGPPDDGEPIGFYDNDGDGDPDTVTVAGGAVAGINIAINQRYNAAPLILYVDDNAAGLGDGTSWHDAYTNLTLALSAAAAGMEIWMAAGVYKPGAARTNTYTLKNGVKVFGGFHGDEVLREERHLKANTTVLSGEIGGGAAADNIYHVVTANSTDRTAVLSDLTITRGYANDEGSGYSGFGGGIKARQASPSIINVRFLDNYAQAGGGGIEVAKSTSPGVLVVNCVFSGNATPGLGGAGILSWDWSGGGGLALVFNSSFAGNTGSAILVNGPNSNAILYQTIVSGGLAVMTNGGLQVFSGLLSGACPATASCDSNTLLSTNAMFIDANGADDVYGTLDDDLRLQAASPGLDSGDNGLLQPDDADMDGDGDHTELTPIDLDGLPRRLDAPAADTGLGAPPIVDRGAYELYDPSMYIKYLYLPVALKK